MAGYDLYSLVLCLIVFVLLVGLSFLLLREIYKLTIKTIRHGIEDEEIKKECSKERKKTGGAKRLETIVTMVLCVLLCVFFAFSLFVDCDGAAQRVHLPTLRVVRSGSMSKKNEKNTYLYTYELDDQIRTFDLILTHDIPAEDDISLYDIVVYQADDRMVVHRIVGIEEPNERHPDERWFLCQGDANSVSDRFPVKYEQLIGIYRGERVPYLGSFVLFMQSPAGWLCILLVLASIILVPIIEKKVLEEKRARYDVICQAEQPPQLPDAQETVEESRFAGLARGERESFASRLDKHDVARQRYEAVAGLLRRIEGVRIITAKYSETYKKGKTPLARLAIKGKTLNCYLGTQPEEYKDSKYVFTDESHVKAHANYPMRIRLTSDRQVRWTNELIESLCFKNGFKICKINPFAHLSAKRDDRTFDEKIRELPVALERYREIAAYLSQIEGIRMISGKKFKTYKLGNAPIARFAVRGKTLNVYCGLQPAQFQNTKYVFTDMSGVRAHKNYPMRVRITSSRQVRWVKELISKAISQVKRDG